MYGLVRRCFSLCKGGIQYSWLANSWDKKKRKLNQRLDEGKFGRIEEWKENVSVYVQTMKSLKKSLLQIQVHKFKRKEQCQKSRITSSYWVKRQIKKRDKKSNFLIQTEWFHLWTKKRKNCKSFYWRWQKFVIGHDNQWGYKNYHILSYIQSG